MHLQLFHRPVGVSKWANRLYVCQPVRHPLSVSWVPSVGPHRRTVPLPSVVIEKVVAPAENGDNFKLSALFLYLRQC